MRLGEIYMNWDAVGAIAELIGTLVILVTLIYLAVQVKYARLTATDANRNGRVVGIRDLNGNLVTNAEARARGIRPWARYRRP